MVSTIQYFTGEYLSKCVFPRDRAVVLQGPQSAAELALLSQDEDICLDLRYLNGRPSDPAFDAFWAKAGVLLEEYRRVDDRRHGKSLHDV